MLYIHVAASKYTPALRISCVLVNVSFAPGNERYHTTVRSLRMQQREPAWLSGAEGDEAPRLHDMFLHNNNCTGAEYW